jgi:hypothetical protein
MCRWLTVFSSGFYSISLLHFSRMFFNTLIDEGLLNILMHDCKNSLIVLTCSLGCIMLVWSSDGGMLYSRASLLFCAVTTMSSFWNSYQASVNISFSFCASIYLLVSGFFYTHLFCAGSYWTASFPVFVPPRVTMFMFRLSSIASAKIHRTSWLFWFFFFCIVTSSVRHSFVSWSEVRQYIQVTGGSGHFHA